MAHSLTRVTLSTIRRSLSSTVGLRPCVPTLLKKQACHIIPGELREMVGADRIEGRRDLRV
jgi:hypothetical protein